MFKVIDLLLVSLSLSWQSTHTVDCDYPIYVHGPFELLNPSVGIQQKLEEDFTAFFLAHLTGSTSIDCVFLSGILNVFLAHAVLFIFAY